MKKKISLIPFWIIGISLMISSIASVFLVFQNNQFLSLQTSPPTEHDEDLCAKLNSFYCTNLNIYNACCVGEQPDWPINIFPPDDEFPFEPSPENSNSCINILRRMADALSLMNDINCPSEYLHQCPDYNNDINKGLHEACWGTPYNSAESDEAK